MFAGPRIHGKRNIGIFAQLSNNLNSLKGLFKFTSCSTNVFASESKKFLEIGNRKTKIDGQETKQTKTVTSPARTNIWVE